MKMPGSTPVSIDSIETLARGNCKGAGAARQGEPEFPAEEANVRISAFREVAEGHETGATNIGGEAGYLGRA
jgi:hypothetical protein